ncbi:hypothetical protein Poly59_30170 [Rubripirellula reticaptiva]|uniref:DUF983 domain-containing protein n=1 Tax=Rubripirellula reticaptiva TaxID=2528013 RepID=A0A5C6ES17_9BACT|nr:hypothetical protein Poly59_30170 [Rubripirellula reticaptiva]
MHAKPDLRVVWKWMIAGSGSVIADVPRLKDLTRQPTLIDHENPYAPASTLPASNRGNCPICGNRVGYVRFIFPFGHCGDCGNYLTVRNWDGASWPWSVVLFLIIASPIIARYTLGPGSDAPTIRLLLCWLVAHTIYDKLVGRLVPAVCWGLVALRDDDRLPSKDSPHCQS